jgi:hypothetical protein
MEFQVKEKCPRCGGEVRLATIEPHDTKRHIAVHSFHCANCGEVSVKEYDLSIRGRSKASPYGQEE